jgi:hypothetical protein
MEMPSNDMETELANTLPRHCGIINGSDKSSKLMRDYKNH